MLTFQPDSVSINTERRSKFPPLNMKMYEGLEVRYMAGLEVSRAWNRRDQVERV